MTNTAKEYYSLVEIKMRWPCAGTQVKKWSRADPQWRFKKMGDARASMMAPELAYQNLLLSRFLLPAKA